jgi:hypothetical protein
MKDAVKITVIATGFRPETMRSRRKADAAAAAAAPVAASQPAPAPQREVNVWQGVTPGNGSILQHPVRRDDLEVPTFLRMKNDGYSR